MLLEVFNGLVSSSCIFKIFRCVKPLLVIMPVTVPRGSYRKRGCQMGWLLAIHFRIPKVARIILKYY